MTRAKYPCSHLLSNQQPPAQLVFKGIEGKDIREGVVLGGLWAVEAAVWRMIVANMLQRIRHTPKNRATMGNGISTKYIWFIF